MSGLSWDEFYFNMIEVVASKSKDRSTKVGTVIVGPSNEVRTVGYNGFARGVSDDVDERHSRENGVKYLWTEHAERNAIYNAARVGIPLEGCKIYVNLFPCSRCARAIIQSGITEVIIDERNKSEECNERWKDDMECAMQMLKEARVTIRFHTEEK